MGTRLWAIGTAVAGVSTLGTTLAFQMLPEVTAQGECAVTDGVVLYEFARSIEDLNAIFGTPGAACRDAIIIAMDAINHLDVLLYIPSYTLFVALAALFLSGGRWTVPVMAAIACAGVALIADYVETTGLLAYTPELSPPASDLARTSSAAWIKFAALGLNSVFLAWIVLAKPTTLRIALAVVLCLPLVGVAATYVDIKWIAMLTLGFVAAWPLVLILAIIGAVRGRAFGGSA